MENLSTNELCDYITSNIGLPLPTYCYQYKTYVCSTPLNVSFGDSVKGIEQTTPHKTFREACLTLIQWHNTINQ